MENLWGKLENKNNDILFPKEILDEQSNFLVSMTDGKLYGEVVDYIDDDWDELELYEVKETDFCYRFFIRSRFMEKYRFGVLTIFHNIEMYPVYIKTDEGIHKEISGKKSGFLQADSEGEYKKLLEKILQSEKIKIVLNSLNRLSK
ncbi:hypothetical protein [Exiguobacterium acetylicum]|uniref:hypothetical protein n=1 Tax=Exiguobacterium acetylicum TaxID=41170 RepID=UPI0034D5FF77